MRDALLLSQRDTVALMGAVVALARDGSRDPSVRALLAEAAADVEERSGSVGSPVAVFQAAYTLALRGFHYLPDPTGDELVQPPALTLAQGAGDCEDATALVLALARGVGLNGRAVLVARTAPGVAPEAIHAYAEVELSPGRYVPADLAMYLGLGEPMGFSPGTEFHRFDVDAGDHARGVGFLDGLLGGIFGLFSSENNRKGAEAQAQATVRAAEEQHAAAVEAAARQATAVERQARATERIAQRQSLVLAAQLKSGERGLVRALGLVRELAPLTGLVLLAFALSPSLKNLTAARKLPPVPKPPTHEGRALPRSTSNGARQHARKAPHARRARQRRAA